ncbi:MAG: alpha/beta hydrolase [Anaerolineae bacterium]|nr:alpha/beta hydrolase [Anaerolineae bacterium]
MEHYRPLDELLPARWQSGFVTADDGARLHFRRTGGDKPALVLLHGVQVSGASWLRTALALEDRFDVVMPDSRGHGNSARADSLITHERLIVDVQAILRALNLHNPAVIGHSMGADVAGRLAAVEPLRAVILVDPALQSFAPAALLSGDEPPPWMAPILEAMARLKTLPHPERMQAGLSLLPPGTPPWAEMDYVSFVDGQIGFDPGFFRSAVKMGYLFEAPDLIARIACPVLLLTARPMMPGANLEPGQRAFTENWQRGEHVHFEDAGHFVMFDQFERFLDVVTRFIATA